MGYNIRNPDGVAVVFGIEDYMYSPSVTYAYNDAEIFREYLIHTFGYARENIYFRTNERATKGEFDKVFSENGWIANHATEDSDVIIYYSGHGAPDIETEETYLIPYDVDPNYATTGYSLTELYRNVSTITSRSITIVLDACFSGRTRENEMLLVSARPVGIAFKESAVPSNVTVFTSATGSQISSGYEGKLHGLFTYYFLNGLRGNADCDEDGTIIVSEMYDYLSSNVTNQAKKLGREQTPQLLGTDTERTLLNVR